MYKQVLILALLLFLFIFVEQPMISKHTVHLDQKTIHKASAESYAKIIPHLETIDDIDVLWTAPSSTGSPCGILFVAHGCGHSHTDWFSECGEEEKCLGLPEEVAIVQLALERNLVVVAISSANRQSKCWKLTEDGPRVATVLHQISKRFSAEGGEKGLPLFAFGASSGGAFVSRLSSYIQLDGFLSQISATLNPEKVDCMVYLTMNKDENSDQAAAEIAAAADHGMHFRLPALQISSPSFFSERIQNLPISTSRSIVDSLKSGGYVDEAGFLLEDPRQSDWRSAVRTFSGSDSLIADESALAEVMNVAYGLHEMTREGVREGLDFCLQLQTEQPCSAK